MRHAGVRHAGGTGGPARRPALVAWVGWAVPIAGNIVVHRVILPVRSGGRVPGLVITSSGWRASQPTAGGRCEATAVQLRGHRGRSGTGKAGTPADRCPAT